AVDRRQPPPGLSPQAQAAVRQRRAGRRHAEVRDSQGDADRLKIAIVRSPTSRIRLAPRLDDAGMAGALHLQHRLEDRELLWHFLARRTNHQTTPTAPFRRVSGTVV